MTSPIEDFDRIVRGAAEQKPTESFTTAAVLGGSIAGLLAARVLADHAREVVIIERDELTASRGSNVPQADQGHALLDGGLRQIERWLPGFTDQAQRFGAVLRPWPKHRVYLDDNYATGEGTRPMLAASRPFLESLIRERVVALPNVRTIRGRVTGLQFRDDAVVGVRYRTSDEADHTLAMDFAVDATGRASKLSDWLEQAGYGRPRLERLDIDIEYATAYLRRPEPLEAQDLWGTTVRYSPGAEPDGMVAAWVAAVEDDRWMVFTMTQGRNWSARSLDTLRATLRTLPALFKQVVDAELVGEIRTYRQGDSRRRDFTGLRLPARLIPVGDAVASFNPTYGQGISSAALQASCLELFLYDRPELDKPADEFLRLQKIVVDAAWMITAGADAARRDIRDGAEVPEHVRAQRETMNRITAAGLVDPTIWKAISDVTAMIVHPGTLGDPDLVRRAMEATAS